MIGKVEILAFPDGMALLGSHHRQTHLSIHEERQLSVTLVILRFPQMQKPRFRFSPLFPPLLLSLSTMSNSALPSAFLCHGPLAPSQCRPVACTSRRTTLNPVHPFRMRLHRPCVHLQGTTSSKADVQSLTSSSSRDLHVYLFCTIVGWGKNVFLETLTSIQSEDLQRCFGESPCVLESDVIGGTKFWNEVGRAIKNETVGNHLFLNKNFPSNSWEGARRRLEQFCKDSNRNLRLHAIVPKSPGTDRNPFALLDLAICLSGVQTRSGHPNLDSSSDYTSVVAASFYSFYNHPGGRDGFLQAVSQKLTDQIITLDWVDEEAYRSCPPSIEKNMISLLRRARPCRNTKDPATERLRQQIEQDMRAFQAREEVREFLSRCRLPPEQIARSFLHAMETNG